MAVLPYMANPVGPPWLPASVAEARKLDYWAQIIAGVLGVLLIVVGIINLLVWDRGLGVFYIIDAIIALAFAVLLKGMLFDIIDQGKFKEASDRTLILGIIGLFAGGIPGILLILAYVRMQEVFQPQYQQYQPQNATVAPPQQAPQQPAQGQYQQQPVYQQPAPQYQQPQQQDQMQTLREGIKQDQAAAEQKKKDQKTEMIKCSKCGVQFPSFMHACPNCNEPKSR
jgi:hypothetical protein